MTFWYLAQVLGGALAAAGFVVSFREPRHGYPFRAGRALGGILAIIVGMIVLAAATEAVR
jgi:hypothetical protein